VCVWGGLYLRIIRNKNKVPRVSILPNNWDLENAPRNFQNIPFSIAEYDNHGNSSAYNFPGMNSKI